MEDHAVFECIGEDVVQHSVWLDINTARVMLKSTQNMYPRRKFILLRKVK